MQPKHGRETLTSKIESHFKDVGLEQLGNLEKAQFLFDKGVVFLERHADGSISMDIRERVSS